MSLLRLLGLKIDNYRFWYDVCLLLLFNAIGVFPMKIFTPLTVLVIVDEILLLLMIFANCLDIHIYIYILFNFGRIEKRRKERAVFFSTRPLPSNNFLKLPVLTWLVHSYLKKMLVILPSRLDTDSLGLPTLGYAAWCNRFSDCYRSGGGLSLVWLGCYALLQVLAVWWWPSWSPPSWVH